MTTIKKVFEDADKQFGHLTKAEAYIYKADIKLFLASALIATLEGLKRSTYTPNWWDGEAVDVNDIDKAIAEIKEGMK